MGKPGLRNLVRSVEDTVLGNRSLAFIGSIVTKRRLRILAYHDVNESKQFEHQMSLLRDEYNVVSVDEVLNSVEGRPLPDRAAWVTFDDGDPSVVEVGLPILERFEIPSTIFLCPAVIDTDEPFWWQAVAAALGAGAEFRWRQKVYFQEDSDRLIRSLKTVPDEERRLVVKELVSTAGSDLKASFMRPQLTRQQLERFVVSIGSLANHTWDHPCLDQCSPDEQARQIVQADDYFLAWAPYFRPILAYPNGNFSQSAADTAERLGYRLGLLFDHHLTNTNNPPMRWSRLRVNASSSIWRFRAILSGGHSAAMASRRIGGRTE